MTPNIADSVVIDIPPDILKKNPGLKSLSRQLSIKYAHREIVVEADLKTVGSRLWASLDMVEAFDAAWKRAGARILPLILSADSAEILALPWECLHHPELGFLGKRDGFTLSRRVPGVRGRIDDPPAGPLKVLLFTSLPDDLDAEKERLNTEAEQENVIEALDPWVREGRAQLTCPDDGGFAAFRDLLKHEEYHLVFLSGHGKFLDNSLQGTLSQSFFIFEGEDGRSDLRPADEIAAAITGSHVRCVAFSACQTGKLESRDENVEPRLNAGLALQIYRAGVPHVIGMRESIYDTAGIQFSRAFCDAVGRGDRVDMAMQLARQAITQPFNAKDGPRRDLADVGHAELSYGQWCLPALYTRDPACDLVNRDFSPKEKPFDFLLNDAFEDIQVPLRFIGRRMELRGLGRSLASGRTRRLLITGVGGQGKTSLAGRLAKNLEKRGYRIHGFSARPPADWERFVSHLKWSLDDKLLEQVERNWGRCESEEEKALLLLKALVYQTKGKIVLFFDNLETLQNPDSGAVTHPGLAAWFKAGARLGKDGPVTLITSRWEIPAFEEGPSRHHPLRRPSYGDFLRYGQEFPGAGLNREQMKNLYENLGGNFMGLQLFCAAKQLGADPDAFLERLKQTTKDLRAYMAVERTLGLLNEGERELLNRMRAFVGPVIEDGVKIIGRDLPEPASLLRRLASLSLVDTEFDTELKIRQRRLSPLIAEWLEKQEEMLSPEIVEKAARYEVYFFEKLQPTLDRALTAHAALTRAMLDEEAHRFVLKHLVGYFDRRGMNRTLLNVWLPSLLESEDLSVRGTALGLCGQTYFHLGDFDTALDYLNQSLTIRREIGDLAGEGGTLNDISLIFIAHGDHDTALDYLKQSLTILREDGSKKEVCGTLNNFSTIFKARGEYDTALDYLNQSLTIQREIGSRRGEGVTLNNISQIYDARGDYETALDYLKQSLSIRREIGDRAGEGATLNNISAIYHVRGDYDTALDYLKESLNILRQIGDRAGEGTTLNTISQIFKARGNNDTALDYLKQSLAIRREIGDRAGEGVTLNNISQIFKTWGDYDMALDYVKQSLTIYREIGDRAGEGATLNNIGTIYHDRGDYAAMDYLKQSLNIRREIGDRAGEGDTLNSIGAIYHSRGNYNTALDYLKQSFAILKECGDQAKLCAALFNIGHIHMQKKEMEQALSSWGSAYQIARQIGEARALAALDGLAKQMGGDGLEYWEKLSKQVEG